MIALFKAIRDGWQPPTEVSEEFYYHVRDNQDKYPEHLKGFMSIGCSFVAIRWDSYAKDKAKTNYALRAFNSLMRLKPLLEGIELYSCDYQSLEIPDRSLIYCDPPYADTSGYGFDFSHEEFYVWCQNKVLEGHYLFVSEYNMPDLFEEVWSTEVVVTLCRNRVSRKVERLFRLHEKPAFSLKMY